MTREGSALPPDVQRQDNAVEWPLPVSRSPIFIAVMLAIGVAVSYVVRSVPHAGVPAWETHIDVIVVGLMSGMAVAWSLGGLIDSLMNLARYKWNLLGWAIVAFVWAFWVVARPPDPEALVSSNAQEIMWHNIAFGSFLAFWAGWGLLGIWLTMGFATRRK